MLKYGLANCNLPSDTKNTVLDEEDYVSIEEPILEIKEDIAVEENVETSNEVSPAANNLYMYKYIKNILENWTYVFLCFVCIIFVSIIFSIYNISAIDIFLWMNIYLQRYFSVWHYLLQYLLLFLVLLTAVLQF